MAAQSTASWRSALLQPGRGTKIRRGGARRFDGQPSIRRAPGNRAGVSDRAGSAGNRAGVSDRAGSAGNRAGVSDRSSSIGGGNRGGSLGGGSSRLGGDRIGRRDVSRS